MYRIGDAKTGKYMATKMGYVFFYANWGSALTFSTVETAVAFSQAMSAAMSLIPETDAKPLDLKVLDESKNIVV